jgi:hypothetical protein
MGSYCPRPERLTVSSLRAKLAKSWQLSTFWRLYLYETLLARLAQDLQNVAAELWQLIQKENAVVRQRHVAGHRDLPAPDQPRIRDRVVASAKRPRLDDRRAVAGEAGKAGDAVNAGGFDGFGEGHRRQDR